MERALLFATIGAHEARGGGGVADDGEEQ